jgi:diacylglycerol kinase (ATP)
VLVLIVELINTAIEATVDRIGAQWHELAKRAKDLGSAAVLLALLLCLCIWASALWARLG